MAQDELFILHADGQLTRCREKSGAMQCEEGMKFQDDRPEFEATDRIPDTQPLAMVYALSRAFAVLPGRLEWGCRPLQHASGLSGPLRGRTGARRRADRHHLRPTRRSVHRRRAAGALRAAPALTLALTVLQRRATMPPMVVLRRP